MLQLNLANEIPKIVFDTKIDNCHFDFIYNEVMGWQSHLKGLIVNAGEDVTIKQ